MQGFNKYKYSYNGDNGSSFQRQSSPNVEITNVQEQGKIPKLI